MQALHAKKLEQALRSPYRFPVNLEIQTHLFSYYSFETPFQNQFAQEQNKRVWTYFISVDCFIGICEYVRHAARKKIANIWLRKVGNKGRRPTREYEYPISESDDEEQDFEVYEEADDIIEGGEEDLEDEQMCDEDGEESDDRSYFEPEEGDDDDEFVDSENDDVDYDSSSSSYSPIPRRRSYSSAGFQNRQTASVATPSRPFHSASSSACSSPMSSAPSSPIPSRRSSSPFCAPSPYGSSPRSSPRSSPAPFVGSPSSYGRSHMHNSGGLQRSPTPVRYHSHSPHSISPSNSFYNYNNCNAIPAYNNNSTTTNNTNNNSVTSTPSNCNFTPNFVYPTIYTPTPPPTPPPTPSSSPSPIPISPSPVPPAIQSSQPQPVPDIAQAKTQEADEWSYLQLRPSTSPSMTHADLSHNFISAILGPHYSNNVIQANAVAYSFGTAYPNAHSFPGHSFQTIPSVDPHNCLRHDETGFGEISELIANMEDPFDTNMFLSLPDDHSSRNM